MAEIAAHGAVVQLLLGATARLRLFPRRMIDNYLGRRINRDQDHYDLDDSAAVTYVVPTTRRTY